MVEVAAKESGNVTIIIAMGEHGFILPLACQHIQSCLSCISLQMSEFLIHHI